MTRNDNEVWAARKVGVGPRLWGGLPLEYVTPRVTVPAASGMYHLVAASERAILQSLAVPMVSA